MQETQETWFRSLGWEDPWSRKWQPTPVFLAGKSHGQRSLVGYSPWGHTELAITEQLKTHPPRSMRIELGKSSQEATAGAT